MHGRLERGFTLVEMMIAMLVVGLLLAVAIPAWSNALARTHAAAARAALLATLTGAVRHAAITGTEVVVCPSDGADCRGGWDWTGGWIAYADSDGDRSRAAGETLLDRHPPLAEDVRLLTSRGRRRLVFQPNGGNAGSNATFTLCAGRRPPSATTLVLANSGRFRASRSAAADRLCADGGG